jgi:hypothetical protein
MIRQTDIKRLWDVLMILKQEEDIDDVRKNPPTVVPSEMFTDPEQHRLAGLSSRGSSSPSADSGSSSDARTAYKHEMQILNDPLTQFREEKERAATPEAKHEKQIAGDPFVQGVRSKGLGGGRPAPKVDSQLPLELSSVKQSNGSIDKAAGINENMMAYYRDAARRKKEADKAARTGKAAKEVPAEYSSTPNLIDTATPKTSPGGGADQKSLKKSNESKILKIFRKYGF